MKRLSLALLCSALAASVQAQSLGRLFYSEEERARLDQQRGQPAMDDPARAVGTLRNDGVVTRSIGPATWFVNGQAVDAHTLSGRAIGVRGRQLVLGGEDGRHLTLKPGEQATLDENGQARPSGHAIDIRPGRSR